ncbi:M15 family metallopeptidase [Polynucleobacter sp.]|uniref:M15 family metallopeptidase n=1 Tax=Polynucleobacter sp. TaxID=2029855 RepID=UPI00342AFE26
MGIYCLSLSAFGWALPADFLYLDQVSPSIHTQLQYFTHQNFVGRPIQGYGVNRAIITKPAALALANIQKELNEFGLGLLIFDAYRPQRAVNDFMVWAEDLRDTKISLNTIQMWISEIYLKRVTSQRNRGTAEEALLI